MPFRRQDKMWAQLIWEIRHKPKEVAGAATDILQNWWCGGADDDDDATTKFIK